MTWTRTKRDVVSITLAVLAVIAVLFFTGCGAVTASTKDGKQTYTCVPNPEPRHLPGPELTVER